MVKIRIDLQEDPLIPAGRDLISHLVGAHLAAADEEELLHMVGVALGDVHSSNIDEGMRILTHAAYHAQEVIVRLLQVAAERGIALEGPPGALPPHPSSDAVRDERLRLWSAILDYAE